MPLERGGGRARRELPRDGPAWLAAHHPELALEVEVIHLHHHAVDLEVQAVAAVLPRAAGGHHGVQVVVHLDVAVHPEAVLAQPFERRRLGGELDAVHRAHAVGPHRERASRGEPRVELADRAGGGVARVGEGGLARLRALLVQPGKGGNRHVHLAAHLEQGRSALHPEGDRPDRAEVLGDLLPHLPVSRAWPRAPARRPRRRARWPARPPSARSRSGSRPARPPGAGGSARCAPPTPSSPPRCGRWPARASAGGGAPARTCPAAAPPRAGSGNRGSGARGARPPDPAARSAGRRIRSRRSPGRRGRSSGGCARSSSVRSSDARSDGTAFKLRGPPVASGGRGRSR